MADRVKRSGVYFSSVDLDGIIIFFSIMPSLIKKASCRFGDVKSRNGIRNIDDYNLGVHSRVSLRQIFTTVKMFMFGLS